MKHKIEIQTSEIYNYRGIIAIVRIEEFGHKRNEPKDKRSIKFGMLDLIKVRLNHTKTVK